MSPETSAEEGVEAGQDVIWLLGRLDPSLPKSFLHAAGNALDFGLQTTKAGVLCGAFSYTATLDENFVLHEQLSELYVLAIRQKRFTAARILQAWQAGIRILLRGSS